MERAEERVGVVEGMEGGTEAKSGKFGAHDIGGLEGEYGAIDRTEKGFQLWEMQVCFYKVALSSIHSDYHQHVNNV